MCQCVSIMRPATDTASVTLMPPFTIDWKALARPLRSEALSSCQDSVTVSSSLSCSSLSTILPSGLKTPNRASRHASRTEAAWEPPHRAALKPQAANGPKPRKPKARKPRVPTKTTEERIESRREYDRTRRQTDERKEFQRLYKQKVRQERKAAGICRQCSNKAITGQIRCEVCRDKHNRNG